VWNAWGGKEKISAEDPMGARSGPPSAHLLACGPCGEDFTGLLAAVTGG
jgi:hypothetical protein